MYQDSKTRKFVIKNANLLLERPKPYYLQSIPPY